MATLVLTAVGTALGGPLGGALGAMLGQSADAVLFAPKARQGPRLSDLKVQTSSYGDRIPEIFGMMRVAGTVIWASDLIERRAKRSNGKGRPKTIDYSYSACFAVALSSRPIGQIRRIWADGKILRDSSGAMAEAGALRIYSGDPDQPIDPLIASVVGLERCSAFRGIAYALFDGLELAAFGNRIPQLSFEVEADSGLVAPGAVAAAISGLTVVDSAPTMTGYAAVGERAGDVLAPLAAWADLGAATLDGAVSLAPPSQGAGAADADDARLARVHRAAALAVDEDRRVPWSRVPQSIAVRHYDPPRDYQTSIQTEPIAGASGAARQIELPAALGADAARAGAAALALSVSGRRKSVTVTAGYGALTLPLGRAIAMPLAGGEGPRWRISERLVSDHAVQLTLIEEPLSDALDSRAADGGAAIVSPDLPATSAMLTIFDMPGDGDTARAAPLRLIAAGGADPGWRGADLWWAASADAEPDALERIGQAAAVGVLSSPLSAQATRLIDRALSCAVTLANDQMTLQNSNVAGLAAGHNMAMIDDELIQFERALPLGAGQWRIEGLLRGRGGTEKTGAGHAAGAAFALIDDAALLALPDALALRSVAGGAQLDWMARGSATMQRVAIGGGQRAMLPLSPVHGRAQALADGSVRLRWVPRSRTGAAWRDGVDAPLGETMLLFQLTYADGASIPVLRTVMAAELMLGAGDFAPGSMVAIAQIGDFGLSPPLLIALP